MHWSEDLEREFRRERILGFLCRAAAFIALTALLFCFGWLLTACTTQKPTAAVPQQVIIYNCINYNLTSAFIKGDID